ncbi:MAG: response regulator transcription factor [Cytophagaceae bacterium]|nr:response regulator transcription factor [Cytophagaceae bacterium]
MNCKILIVDDHKMVRDGIRYMLESQTKKYNFLVDEADNGLDGVDQALSGEYDVVIMDYQLPNIDGLEATKRIIAKAPETKILALSNYDEYTYIQNIIQAGAKGFVLKNIGPDELVTAIETVRNGKNYYSNDVAVKLIHYVNNQPQTRQRNTHELSEREIEIIRMIASEKTNEEIAQELNLSKRTVDTHRQRILEKLNVKNTAGLIRIAVQEGLV